MLPTPFDSLAAFDENDDLNAVIETPKGSRNKYDYDPKRGLFVLGGVLPAGASFPFDFGFVPCTLGEDGDPLDVLVLMDEPAFTGCLVPARLIGIIEAEQTERDGEAMRNDRLIAVDSNYRQQEDVKNVRDLNRAVIKEIEHFFISYNKYKGKKFKVLNCRSHSHAHKMVREGQKRLKAKQS